MFVRRFGRTTSKLGCFSASVLFIKRETGVGKRFTRGVVTPLAVSAWWVAIVCFGWVFQMTKYWTVGVVGDRAVGTAAGNGVVVKRKVSVGIVGRSGATRAWISFCIRAVWCRDAAARVRHALVCVWIALHVHGAVVVGLARQNWHLPALVNRVKVGCDATNVARCNTNNGAYTGVVVKFRGFTAVSVDDVGGTGKP